MQMRHAMLTLLATEGTANVVTATLLWRTVTRPLGYDRNDEDSAVGSVVAHGSLPFRAFFHQVEARLSGFQRFLEVETGDVILDYMEELALPGKENVRVLVNGYLYAQKTASTKLLEAWDVTMGNGGLLKSVLLTPLGPQEVLPGNAMLEGDGDSMMSNGDEFILA